MKCEFPPCDETAKHLVVATCSCRFHPRIEFRVCDGHREECESTVKRVLAAPHHTHRVVQLADDACACPTIETGGLGFCRDHRRACIPVDAGREERQLIEALAKHAQIPMTTAPDGSRLGVPS